MQPIQGNMTQHDYSRLNAELINLEMLQMLKYSKARVKRIKVLKKEMGIEK